MTRPRALLLALPLLVLALPLVVVPSALPAAHAAPVPALAPALAPDRPSQTTPAALLEALRGDPVQVLAGSDVDAAEVRRAVQDASAQVYVVALPSGSNPRSVLSSVGPGLGSRAVLVVAAGGSVTAGAGGGTGLGTGQAARIAAASTGSEPTASVVSAVRALDEAVLTAGAAGAGDDAVEGGGVSGTVLLGLVGAGLAGAGVLVSRRNRRRRLDADEADRADVQSLYDRLGHDVSTLAAGDDEVARRALADASERYTATGALMSVADTPGEWVAARRTAAEGLAATRLARTRLGLDPGPDVPLEGTGGPQLTARERVRVGDEEVEGSPEYEPGRPYHFGGGTVGGQWVPGGWYPTRFWDGLLLGTVLTGGLGGFGGFGYGGGFGGGYADGYGDGYAEGADGGGDWDGGGGDWGGGGFDVGGGDWGGGGDLGGDW